MKGKLVNQQDGPIVLSTPVTHTDWLWRDMKRIGHGPRSVRYILDRCKQVGWTRIYWRCFDGGQCFFKSRLMESVSRGYAADNFHAWWPEFLPSDGPEYLQKLFKGFDEFDSLGEAVRYGRQIGLEMHAWISINEDDHGWGLQSRFSREHPQYRWVKRSGVPYNSQLSFAFEEVRRYKLELLKEILAYDIDGVFLDWMRTGDIRNEPQATADGTADYGYEKPLVEAFEKQYGVKPTEVPNDDERWVRMRAEPQSLFMRAAHDLIKGKSRSLSISFMGHHPWSYRWKSPPHINGNLNGLLLDVRSWAQKGWIDEAVAAGNYIPGGTPEMAYAYMKDLVGNYCPVWSYSWTPRDAKAFEESIQLASKLGAGQILHWEADHIDLPERRQDAQLNAAMNNYATRKL
ncbi:MAG: family 10 glycosylhydrolase [Phycisphaerales bacterium]|jgi:uncharacterized lipoprotein YddW (UPF0748 family)|nr:family 10 glycosylhydrolase [Phycisphaerales bacterium]